MTKNNAIILTLARNLIKNINAELPFLDYKIAAIMEVTLETAIYLESKCLEVEGLIEANKLTVKMQRIALGRKTSDYRLSLINKKKN